MTAEGLEPNGLDPLSAKNSRDEAAIANAAADRLNRIRPAERDVRTNRLESTAASIAATTAPGPGPNISAAVNVKRSEIEKLTGTVGGIRSTNCALTTVIKASATQRPSGGATIIETIDNTTSVQPVQVMART